MQRLQSQQNEFNNDFRRRFHISADGEATSQRPADNTAILDRVRALRGSGEVIRGVLIFFFFLEHPESHFFIANYASPSFGNAYSDRQLTPNF